MKSFISLFLHLDQHLQTILTTYGTWTYVILFLVVFCETGLVVTPFLPGDSLLFITGAFTASGYLEYFPIYFLLIIAAIIGDGVNYYFGSKFGHSVFNWKIPYLKKEHLTRTQQFYEKYGVTTIILARFVPIVRTFAPFVAGIGQMSYKRFMIYNVVGAVLWVSIFLTLGHFFGNIPMVKNNLTLVLIAIIFISVLPMVFEFCKHHFASKVKRGEV